MSAPTNILAAIATISARFGCGHLGSASPEAVLAMLRMDRGRFIREVKALADGGLLEIDDDSGNLALTEAGSRKVADNERS